MALDFDGFDLKGIDPVLGSRVKRVSKSAIISASGNWKEKEPMLSSPQACTAIKIGEILDFVSYVESFFKSKIYGQNPILTLRELCDLLASLIERCIAFKLFYTSE